MLNIAFMAFLSFWDCQLYTQALKKLYITIPALMAST